MNGFLKMKKLSPKAEELRQAIQDGIELEGITADAIVQTIVEVLGIDVVMMESSFRHALDLAMKDGDLPEMYVPHEIGLLISCLLELSKWTP